MRCAALKLSIEIQKSQIYLLMKYCLFKVIGMTSYMQLQKTRRAILTCFVALLIISAPACTRLMFVPTPQYVRTPDQIGIDYDDVWVKTRFGTHLHGWLLKSAQPAKGNVLFLHGNGENISTHFVSVAWLTTQAYNVLIYDYQGYAQSTGTPDLSQEIDNVSLMIDYLSDYAQGSSIVVYGQSLGGAIAAAAMHNEASRPKVSMLVLESTFPNFRRIVQDKLSEHWLTWSLQWPVSLGFISSRNPEDALAELAPMPILVIHGQRDRIVSYENGVALFQSARSPAALWTISDGGHIMAYVSPEFRASFSAVLNDIAAKRQPLLTEQVFHLPEPVVEFLKQRNIY